MSFICDVVPGISSGDLFPLSLVEQRVEGKIVAIGRSAEARTLVDRTGKVLAA